MIFQRHDQGPLWTREDIPDMPPEIVDPSSVFNPGAFSRKGKTYLLLRVQTRGRRTFTVPACGDGLTFELASRPVVYSGHGPATTIGDEKRLNPWLQQTPVY